MTYSTGSATNLTDLRAKILAFAQADLWTDVSGSWPIGDGQCFVNVVKGPDLSDFDGAVGLTENKPRLYGALGTSLPGAAPGNWWQMPGNPASSETDGNYNHYAFGTRLDGSIPEYHLFSGGGGAGTRYIHCAFRNGPDTWGHFSFGNLDKKLLTHSGVGYLATSQWFNYPTDAAGVNDANSHALGRYPFVGSFGSDVTHGLTCHIPNAVPVGVPNPITGTNNLCNQNDTVFANGNQITNEQFFFLLSSYHWANPTPAGRFPLYTLPVMAVDTGATPDDYYWVGDFPGVRFCLMVGAAAGDEFTLGSDTWKLFPIARHAPLDIAVDAKVSSGDEAIAYLKVV